MQIVLDCSAAIAMCLPDESANLSTSFLELIRKNTIVVPALWDYEIANSLHSAIRKGRIKVADISEIENKLQRLRMHRAPAPPINILLDIAQRYSLSGYDAAYIVLATQIGASIATFDSRMRSAAKLANLPIIPADEIEPNVT